MLDNFFMIPAVKENTKLKLALAITRAAPVSFTKEKIDTPPLVADKAIKVLLGSSKAAIHLLSFLLIIFLSWMFELKKSLILLISFHLIFVWSLKFEYILVVLMELHLLVFKITKNYTVFFFKIIRRKQTSIIN